ncbi:hypothetical protein ABIB90_006214 [Bradyrhizobium sp. JR4.1]|uniref:hypothetical protein n=1 Tax=Bradyrhizobium sp. JR4.1 TaxID=3156372 RepID=UPI003393A14A
MKQIVFPATVHLTSNELEWRYLTLSLAKAFADIEATGDRRGRKPRPRRMLALLLEREASLPRQALATAFAKHDSEIVLLRATTSRWV